MNQKEKDQKACAVMLFITYILCFLLMFVLVLFIPPVFAIAISLSIFAVIFCILRFSYGPEFVSQEEWKEEGCYSMKEWLRESSFRNSNYFRAVFILFWIFLGIFLVFVGFFWV